MRTYFDYALFNALAITSRLPTTRNPHPLTFYGGNVIYLLKVCRHLSI